MTRKAPSAQGAAPGLGAESAETEEELHHADEQYGVTAA
jgi:hypothetical protein